MGRSALLLVLALAVAFGYIGNSIHTYSNLLVETHSTYFQYSNARNLARMGINRVLRFIASDGIVRNPSYNALVCNFNDGSYRVDTSSVADTLTIISRGRYQDTTYTMNVKLLWTPRPIPEAAGAVGINTNIGDFQPGNKKLKVDGRNYTEDGSTRVGSGDVPGFTVKNTNDSIKIANQRNSLSGIEGNPIIKINPNQEDPQDYLNEYIKAASFSYDKNNQPPNNITFGTATEPTIVTCNPMGDTTYGVNMPKVTGYGILVIYGGGTVKFTGQFDWRGLVIVYGVDTKLDFQTTGQANIIGGLIIAGNINNTVDVKINGEADIKYSSAAIQKARRVPNLSFYRILDWYE